jgi:hypothetical protein
MLGVLLSSYIVIIYKKYHTQDAIEKVSDRISHSSHSFRLPKENEILIVLTAKPTFDRMDLCARLATDKKRSGPHFGVDGKRLFKSEVHESLWRKLLLGSGSLSTFWVYC